MVVPNSVSDPIKILETTNNPLSFNGSTGSVFHITAEGEVVCDDKVITNDDAAIADCFFKWIEAMAIAIDGKPLVLNRQ